MASVEDRVVRMEFDNASFERKLESTLASLGNLEKALKFEGATKGLSDIQASADKINFATMNGHIGNVSKGLSDIQSNADKFNLGAMNTHIESVSKKFLALSAVAITVLTNITTKAMDAGTQIAKSLTLDNVIAGFKEYETNIGSIQTILANTKSDNTNLEQVNAALDELNTYSDKTIYNFGQMVRNIGTFTAAGVDLKTSVGAIKGIANIAAISGSNAEQAASAMYQLSQALAAGTLKAMDWNSVVNAGMGGEILQKALFDTGKAVGTLKNVPLDQSFDDWKKAGNSFKASLEDGWITTEVMTTAFKAFSGEMTEGELAAKGFSKEMAASFIELGNLGVDSATKVRTFTQLISTTKEAIGSGWSETFRIIIGNFEEATELFTGLSNTIGDFIRRTSDARNEMLQTWKDMGGRALLIEALRTAFQNLGEVLKPIKDAFREVFPKATAFDLLNLTKAFELLMIKLKPGKDTIEAIHSVFKGFFSVLQIGWEIVKEGAKFVGRLFEAFGAGSGSFLDFAAKIGDFFTELNNKLVEGEGIKNFFEDLSDIMQGPIDVINDLIDVIGDLFSSILGGDKETDAIDRISARFENLGDIFEAIPSFFEPITNAFSKVIDALDKAWEAVRNWFDNLGESIANSVDASDFNPVMDALNVGLLGGIAAFLYKLSSKGLKIDFGGGVLESLKNTLNELTGVLSAMQTNLKSEALLKIAEAIAILAASLFVLSTIKPEALTRAIGAMSAAFGTLMGAFAILKTMVGPKSAASLALLATGMIALSTAILILSAAMKVLATMSWEEIGKGLTAITGLLTMLSAAAIVLSKNASSFAFLAFSLIEIGVALNILAVAMKIFATMSWEEIGKGLTVVASSLALIGLAMNLMPLDMPLTALGLISVATSMGILAVAMKIFATMSWEEIGKGLAAVAGGLIAISFGMSLMPLNMVLTSLGLLAVGAALVAIGIAMKIMGSMNWEEIGKGLVVMATSLIVLGVAMNSMTSAIPGALAIAIVAPALIVLAMALQAFSTIGWGELISGLAAMGGALAVLGGAAFLLEPVVPALMGLGVALLLIGGAFALFGAGVSFVANALGILAEVGMDAVKVIPELMKAVGKGIPGIMQGLAEGFIQMAQTIADSAPELVSALVVVIIQLLDAIPKLLPRIFIIINQFIVQLLQTISRRAPDFVKTGMDIIIAFFTGIKNSIGEIVSLVSKIIQNFLTAFAAEMPGLTSALAELLISMFVNTAEAVGRVIGQSSIDIGVAFIKGLIEGLSSSAAGGLFEWLVALPGKIVGWIGNVARTLWGKGTELIGGLASAIIDKANDVKNFFTNLPGNILGWIGNLLETLWDKGYDLILGFFRGIKTIWETVISFIMGIPRKIIDNIPNPLTILFDIGKKIMQGLWDGMLEIWNKFTGWVSGIGGWISDHKGPPSEDKVLLVENGKLIIAGLFIGMKDQWNKDSQWFDSIGIKEALTGVVNSGKTIDLNTMFADLPKNISDQIGDALLILYTKGALIIDGLLNGMMSTWPKLMEWVGDVGPKIVNGIPNPLNVLYDTGVQLVQGLLNGILSTWSNVVGWIDAAGNFIANTLRNALGVSSPSKVFMVIGEQTVQGFILGFNRTLYDDETMEASAIEFVDKSTDILKNSLNSVAKNLDNVGEFNPTITPVLDLTQVKLDARKLSDYISSSEKIIAASSYGQAKMIASTPSNIIAPQTGSDSSQLESAIKFEQNIYAPTQLSTSDIYKQTRNQITLAKEELSIP